MEAPKGACDSSERQLEGSSTPLASSTNALLRQLGPCHAKEAGMQHQSCSLEENESMDRVLAVGM